MPFEPVHWQRTEFATAERFASDFHPSVIVGEVLLQNAIEGVGDHGKKKAVAAEGSEPDNERNTMNWTNTQSCLRMPLPASFATSKR